MKKRVHIIYSGMVQGIGFRFTAERMATSLDLTGWVRNNRDGTVEVTAEGQERDLVSFMEKVKRTMGHYIQHTKVNWQDYTGEFESFDIKFY